MTQHTELPAELNKQIDEWLEIHFEDGYSHSSQRTLKELLAQAIQEAVLAERRSWYSPFDGLEIKLMYRDGEKVLQNRHIFSLEQINFIKGLSEVAQLKFSYMLKDLLAESLSQPEGVAPHKEEV